MKEKHIKTNRLFYGENEFSLEESYMEEYMHTVINDHIMLYRVDRVKTKVHPLYNEALPDEKVFINKIEFPCTINITREVPNYAEEGFGYNEQLLCEFKILQRDIDKMGVKINHGDYIEYKDRFFQVTLAHNIAESSQFTKNFRNPIRSYSGRMVKGDEIPIEFLNNDNEIN